jgi:molybdate transport system ATP-binding protein
MSRGRLEADIRMNLGQLGLDLRLAAEDRVLAIAGPNGAGKTTTLLALLGIVRPDAGRISLGATVLFDAAAKIDVPTEDRGLAYVPQDYALFPHLSAEENVAFALACGPGAKGRRQRREEARALLARVGVLACADRLPASLSGGERQRVALARALGRSPRALLFDEPFAALDVGVRTEIRGYLRDRLAELGLPAVVVTHDRADVEALGAEVLILEAGRVVQRGTLADLEANPATEYVARFCGHDRSLPSV